MKKNIFIPATLVLLLCFLLGGCPTDADDDPVKGIPLNLTGLLNFPEIGVTRQVFIDAPEFTAEINWFFTETGSNAMNGQFEPATGNTFTNWFFRAEINMEAKEGFTFDGIAPNSFFHEYAAVARNSRGEGNTITVTLDFPKTPAANTQPVSVTNLLYVITTPTKGVTPQASITETQTGLQFTGFILWMDLDFNLVNPLNDDKYEPDTVYTADISLEACPGYRLIDMDANSFSHPLAQSITYNKLTGAMKIVFRPTAKVDEDSMVTAFNITDITQLGRPRHRSNPVTVFTASQFTGEMEWFYADDGAPIEGPLAYDRPLRAIVNLEPREGFTLNGLPANAFIHHSRAVISVSNAANSGVVTIMYHPAPWELGNTAVTAIPLTPEAHGASMNVCCYYVDEPPRNVFSDNTGIWYDTAYSGNSNTNYSSWPAVFKDPLGGQFTWQQTQPGHASVFLRPSIPEEFRRHAHVFTLDLGRRVDNIVQLSLRVRGGGESPTARFLKEFEVYYSLTEIGPVPGSNATYTGFYNIDDDGVLRSGTTLGNNSWVDFNIFQGQENVRPFSARYIHVRVFKTTNTIFPGDGIILSFGQIGVRTVGPTAFP